MIADVTCESGISAAAGGCGDAEVALSEGGASSSSSNTFSYDEVFPALPEKEALHEVSTSVGNLGQWNQKMHVKSSVITQIFQVPSEERRFRETSSQRFGELGEQAKICADIMRDTSTIIEVSSSKDHSLTVLVTGRESNVSVARAAILRHLQTQAQISISIPKEHHRFILGRNGTKLQELEQATSTKITVPRPDDNSDVITIVGPKEGIDRAREQIQFISDEKSKQASEKLHVERIYQPFISGPYGSTVKGLEKDTGTRIRLDREKDEVTIVGDKDCVARAKEAILSIYNEKKSRCQVVSVEVKKSQHKYVHGTRGQTLQELFEETGVWVEMPALEDDCETITLRGDPQNLGQALSLVYKKASSVKIEEIPAKSWTHKYIIGKKGENIKKITSEHTKTHVDFLEDDHKIRIEGPVEDIDAVRAALEESVREITSTMDCAEIQVNPLFHRHIIGRSGANVNRLKQELNVTIHIPADGERCPTIRIEGPPQGVAQAKEELLEMVHKLESEVTRELLVEPRFHRTLIGAKGESIQEVRRRFNQVNVTFPEPGTNSNRVLIRGPREDVEACYQHLTQLCRELAISSHRVDLVVFKQFLKHVQGKGRQTLRKIQQETETRIELPPENSNSDIISITGKKENVSAAKEKIMEAQKELADVVEVSLMIPASLHNSLIGTKGRLIHSIMEECGRVHIAFPPLDSNSDRVTLTGPKEDVDRAKRQLLDLANEKQLSSFTAEVRAKPEHHRFLIGKNGANIKKVREKTGARVMFPNEKDEDVITIIGKKEAVLEAKKELEEMIEELENVVREEMQVDVKHHRYFVARRGEELRLIADEFGGVQVSFPRSGDQSNTVVLKGARECVEGARQRILEIVKELDSRVSIECVIPQQHHRSVMGAKGYKVQRIQQDHNVHIKFPERGTRDRDMLENGEVNGDFEGTVEDVDPNRVRKEDIIIITGKQEDCERAKEALLAVVPVTKEVEVPLKLHRFIIGQKGAGVRRLKEEYDVTIIVPSADEESNVLQVSGSPANVDAACQALYQRVEQLLEEEEDRKLRSFSVEVEVPARYHPKIIGLRGAVVTKIRKEHGVQIQFPDKGAPNEDVIVITGYEKNAEAARDEILRIVKEWEDMITRDVEIDHRVHSRLIGARGRNIRKIMEQYKVEIKFPRAEDMNKDLVQVTGSEEAVEEVIDHLRDVEDKYLEEVRDLENSRAARALSHFVANGGNWSTSGGDCGRSDNSHHHQQSREFVVRGGPWEQRAPDTTSTQEFPSFGGGPPLESLPSKPVPWGPRR